MPRLPLTVSRVLLVWTFILFKLDTARHHEADERGDNHAEDTGKRVKGVMAGHGNVLARFVPGDAKLL